MLLESANGTRPKSPTTLGNLSFPLCRRVSSGQPFQFPLVGNPTLDYDHALGSSSRAKSTVLGKEPNIWGKTTDFKMHKL